MPYLGIPSSASVVINPVAGQAPAANTNAVATLAADPAAAWHLRQINWSYSAAPAVGSKITITWTDPVTGTGTWTETYYISNGGPGILSFPPKRFPAGSTVTITLTAPGGTIIGTIYVDAWKE